ncbi:MAG: YicC/YloC family endoribonuclease [bacterium]
MIRSMTGVGRAEAVLAPWGSRLVVDIRSVNHKFLELTPRLPGALAGYEGQVRDIVRRRIRRGYVQVQVYLDEESGAPRLRLNHALAREYLSLARDVRRRYGVKGEPDINNLLAFPGILTAEKADSDHARLWRQAERVVNAALRGLIEMKTAEGVALVRDLRGRVTRIQRAVAAIERRVPQRLRERRDNMMAQVKDLGVEAAPKRVLEELAFISEKVDIHEECVRLKSHCSMFLRALRSSATSGKKLDFITQEILRETDTLSAKARDMVISRRAIEIKGEIDKLKEQVRNVE